MNVITKAEALLPCNCEADKYFVKSDHSKWCPARFRNAVREALIEADKEGFERARHDERMWLANALT